MNWKSLLQVACSPLRAPLGWKLDVILRRRRRYSNYPIPTTISLPSILAALAHDAATFRGMGMPRRADMQRHFPSGWFAPLLASGWVCTMYHDDSLPPDSQVIHRFWYIVSLLITDTPLIRMTTHVTSFSNGFPMYLTGGPARNSSLNHHLRMSRRNFKWQAKLKRQCINLTMIVLARIHFD